MDRSAQNGNAGNSGVKWKREEEKMKNEIVAVYGNKVLNPKMGFYTRYMTLLLILMNERAFILPDSQ